MVGASRRLSQTAIVFCCCSRAVLEMQMSDGLHEIGYPKWQLVLCLFVVYTMLYLSLFKGVKSSGKLRRIQNGGFRFRPLILNAVGKVVWATATMPYVVLTILLIRGLMLPGAANGISYYLQPELSKLKETQVSISKGMIEIKKKKVSTNTGPRI